MYSIYTLSDPKESRPRYVGLSQDPYKRYGGHLVNLNKTSAKDAWIMGLLDTGVLPALTIIETVETRMRAEEREHHWIHYYLQIGANLLNVAKVEYKPRPVSRSTTQQTRLELSPEAKEIKITLGWHGWTMQIRPRRNKGKLYIYAGRRIKATKKLEWRYICPLLRANAITEEQILEKLNK